MAGHKLARKLLVLAFLFWTTTAQSGWLVHPALVPVNGKPPIDLDSSDDMDTSTVSDFVILISKILADDALLAASEPFVSNLAEKLSRLESSPGIASYNLLKATMTAGYQELLDKLTQMSLLHAVPAALRGESVIDALTWTLVTRRYVPMKKISAGEPIEIEQRIGKLNKIKKVRKILQIGPKASHRWLNTLKNVSLIGAESLTVALQHGLAVWTAVGTYNQLASATSLELWEDFEFTDYGVHDFLKQMFWQASRFIFGRFGSMTSRSLFDRCKATGYFTIDDGEIVHLCQSNRDEDHLVEAYLEHLPFYSSKKLDMLRTKSLVCEEELIEPDRPESWTEVVASQSADFAKHMGGEAITFGIVALTSSLFGWIGSLKPFRWTHALWGGSAGHSDRNFWQRSIRNRGLILRLELARVIKARLIMPLLSRLGRSVIGWFNVEKPTDDDTFEGPRSVGIIKKSDGYYLIKTDPKQLAHSSGQALKQSSPS